MNLSFDYYHNLEETELYLCNPDGRELFPLEAVERKLTLRFNDLSELTFKCYSTTTTNSGEVISLDSFDYLKTRRLVFVTKVGWFVITEVSENDNGVVLYKDVKCESLQATFKDRGIYCEERVYYLYNSSDPYDSNYNPEDESSVPSVLGQLYQQLSIQQDLSQGRSDPDEPYEDWTITYVNSSFTGKGRNFKESTSFGYEWMTKDVEEAFSAIVLFDFYYKTIQIVLPSEITEKANVIYSFSNFMKDVEIEENAENIVTVMNCNGDGCDITGVNPTGTNYICDFSYYMDAEGKWMSSGLKSHLTNWRAAVQAQKSTYESTVLSMRTKYAQLVELNDDLQEYSKIYGDLNAAVSNRAMVMKGQASQLGGVVWAETVKMDSKSIDDYSSFHSTPLRQTSSITAYKNPPTYNASTGTWSCSGASVSGTVAYCYSQVSDNQQYLYFLDESSAKSYCKLTGKASVNVSTNTAEYTCSGFERFVALNTDASIPCMVKWWMGKYDNLIRTKQTLKESYESAIAGFKNTLTNISNQLNILKYFANDSGRSQYLKELMCYWIEGDYSNENIVVDDDTTPDEEIDLANELLDSGYTELSKVCQPKIQFSLSSVDCSKQIEFRQQMAALELGKVITVEKKEGLWYYPALLEMEYDLDHTDTFNLKFANALRLDDWGFTYGDLLSEASSTSRQVSANWQNLLQYAKDKSEITSLIREPLSATLHKAFANMTNQEFLVDDTGILGRKFSDDSQTVYLDEQMRIINNVILFTDDAWQTAKTALGKILYYDENNNPSYAYGLIGETIVGSLMMSEKLAVKNADSSILLNENGITIKNGNTVVFEATTAGTLTIGGYATSAELQQGLATKNRTYYQTSTPTGTLVAGDLWIDTDDSNKLYRYNGSQWESVGDTRVDGSVQDVQVLYYLNTSGTTPSAPSTWITATDQGAWKWTRAIPTPSANCYYYTCTQTKTALGTVQSSIVRRLETDNTILNWCATADITKIDGGNIYTHSIYADSLNTNSIVTSFLTVKDRSNNVIFKADAGNNTVKIGGFTVQRDSFYSNGHSSLNDTSYSGVYIGSDGIGILSNGGTHSLKLDIANASFSFRGNIYATGGTFSGSLSAATGTFAGSLSAATGTFAGSISSATGIFSGGISGELKDGVTIGTNGHCTLNAYNSGHGLTGMTLAYSSTGYLRIGQSSQGEELWLNASRYITLGADKNGGSIYGQARYVTLGTISPNAGYATIGRLYGNWYLNGSTTAVTSDANLKNTVVSLNDRYSEFFDSLRPVSFKYNNGSSDRLHIGFIAQEVRDALVGAHLTAQDFGGYVAFTDENDDTTLYLRYEEFIALNTQEIQKLKRRIASLEREIAALRN